MTRVELSTVKKWRNNSEWRNISRATCCGVSVTGEGEIVAKAIQAAIDEGNTCGGDVMVYRNGTLCFTPAPVSVWLEGKQFSGKQPEHLKR